MKRVWSGVLVGCGVERGFKLWFECGIVWSLVRSGELRVDSVVKFSLVE